MRRELEDSRMGSWLELWGLIVGTWPGGYAVTLREFWGHIGRKVGGARG